MTGREYLRSIGLMDLMPGKRIRTGWQIDMFAGFSGATPSLWAMGGFDAMFSRWEGTKEMAEQFQVPPVLVLRGCTLVFCTLRASY